MIWTRHHERMQGTYRIPANGRDNWFAELRYDFPVGKEVGHVGFRNYVSDVRVGASETGILAHMSCPSFP